MAMVLVTCSKLMSVGRHDWCSGLVFHRARKHHLAILLLLAPSFTTDPVDQAMLLLRLLMGLLLLLFICNRDQHRSEILLPVTGIVIRKQCI